MWDNLRADFRRAHAHTSYRGAVRKTLHTLTSPGFQAVWSYRLTRWLMARHVPIVGAIIQRLTEVWTGISIPPETTVGQGLLIHHFGGIIINSAAVLGAECTLHHGITIGNRVSGGPSPILGDRVMVGAGAKVLGGIIIGSDAEIGANAIVLKSLPPGAVAVGMPARVVRIKAASQMVGPALVAAADAVAGERDG